ncbi:failed axon connections-like [Pecten maximus]|uniref:failed axon connections-like n=1 Tax=Pecten maximus TaxID=6579 RepID=UPI001459060B|nr:failed axon connections-like [Pecten maximus]
MTRCLPNMSPFAMKLEMWLRMNDIPHEVIDHIGFSRKKQSPFVMFNEEEIPDSNFIVETLATYFNKELYPSVSPELKAVGISFLKMVEENSIWTIFLYRHVHHQADYKKYVRYNEVDEVNEAIGADIGNNLKDRAWKHGIGRHSNEEIYKIGCDDVRAISNFLGTKTYFLGDFPTLIDCTLFGFLTQITCVPMDFPMMQVIREECPNILDYVDRLKVQFWPHWDDQKI